MHFTGEKAIIKRPIHEHVLHVHVMHTCNLWYESIQNPSKAECGEKRKRCYLSDPQLGQGMKYVPNAACVYAVSIKVYCELNI